MRTKDLLGARVRVALDALSFPLAVAAGRWLAIAFVLTLPVSSEIPPKIHWALWVYGAITTAFAATYRPRERGSVRINDAHPFVLPALVAIDVAYAALITKLYGISLLVMIPALDLSMIATPLGLGLLVCMDVLIFAVAAHFGTGGPGYGWVRLLGLTLIPYFAVTYAFYGRRRAERQLRAIDQVLNAGSELGAQLSLSDVLVQLQNLLRQFRRVVPWDTSVIYVVQYDETAEEEMLVAAEVAGVDAEAYANKRIAFGTGVAGYAAAKQRAALIADLHKDARQPDGELHKNSRGSLVVPIIGDGQTVGCVQLIAAHPNAYDAEQLGLVGRLVSLASVGVRNALLHSRTRAMADTDSLTGLLTSRAYHERLELEFRKAQAGRTSLSLLIIDLDNFKGINDSFGHPAGDEVLRRFGALLREQARRDDICCRYGGDEFVVVMPGTIKSEAAVVANRIRKTIEEMDFRFGDGRASTTVSIGAASYPQDVTSKHALIKAADDALYAAKQDGRNSLRVHSPASVR
ncbi:MAG TPA: sensor domain-containing diguanylate cyclase [Candidatus Acidoferrales bacterium]|nr:sensor domain-containing diguanylate cyclase [Candidatus Acidoferrales bacterium]